MSEFLPINREEMEARGWQQPDFVYICGDAYVDHPSFGAAIICRTLESHGFKVCFLAQPDWHNVEEFRQFGKPRLGFLISSGNIDSMVNHYTVAKKRRHKDLYTPGSEGFKRPDRAVIVYSQMARQAYKDANIIIGGIEASLRRLGHYDYWDNKVRKSIIIDANADLLLYGMGENSIIEVAEALDSGLEIKYLTYLDGTVFKTKNLDDAHEPVMLPSYEEICNDKKAYAKSFHIQYLNTDHFNAKTLVEPYQGWYVVQNRPNRPLKQREFDRAYSYDYNRDSHPSYRQHVPAIDEVKFSLISNRGCFGSCNFCALAFHRSGIRYDYLMYDKDDTFFKELVQNHISGQLKVAPEHISDQVLDKMGKPRRGLYEKFVDKYYQLNEEYNKKQFLVPYLMSSHPGCTLDDAIELAEYLRDIHHQPEQVQDFYPTPGTLSTTMYYTGLDPRDMSEVYVPKTAKEKAMQRALIQYRNPKNYDLVYEALVQANRKDLIGFGKNCLIRPRRNNNQRSYQAKNNYQKKRRN